MRRKSLSACLIPAPSWRKSLAPLSCTSLLLLKSSMLLCDIFTQIFEHTKSTQYRNLLIYVRCKGYQVNMIHRLNSQTTELLTTQPTSNDWASQDPTSKKTKFLKGIYLKRLNLKFELRSLEPTSEMSKFKYIIYMYIYIYICIPIYVYTVCTYINVQIYT
jgi:hypothetical protein